ncbi:hypothetical protein AEAC466_04610 [Asticcacaulis sp. AC466]|uniref:helix-turn-helix domain-containing protein n=1 Tax=Asticcacaulis sp. AC466 TaxID=1282362 RepID=UPI0003C41042|nr:helix-turn-helix transcriptional regulator [Asticcacaulis sp. AC466]ESQ85450.1 hypothetical protein AEAC466_04610 [Asticcacaulis sp. AC466]
MSPSDPRDIYMPLDSQSIKQFRAEMGWTQEMLATMCGLSTQAIQKWERPGIGAPGHWRVHFAALQAKLLPWVPKA